MQGRPAFGSDADGASGRSGPEERLCSSSTCGPVDLQVLLSGLNEWNPQNRQAAERNFCQETWLEIFLIAHIEERFTKKSDEAREIPSALDLEKVPAETPAPPPSPVEDNSV
ncbi:myocilin opposite strand protein isoform X1 [Ailuropoda melanoleuca]|uniref:myocilin opposite strand protein isoform X1 n=1 Tax=Ailuropoda melanoleuca TaxID=9646 RepID=UPI001494764B|nr:myocilin opposite strand protein isoform X1 [Ailuropoda melanoleuca]